MYEMEIYTKWKGENIIILTVNGEKMHWCKRIGYCFGNGVELLSALLVLAVYQDSKVFRIRKIPLSNTLNSIIEVNNKGDCNPKRKLQYLSQFYIFLHSDCVHLRFFSLKNTFQSYQCSSKENRLKEFYTPHIPNSSLSGERSDIQPSGYMYLGQDFMQICV